MSDYFDQQLQATQAATAPEEEIADTSPEVNSDESSDTGNLYTPKNIKSAVQELLKFGLLEMERKPHLYQTALTQESAINQILEPLDLKLRIDDIRGLAFLVVVDALFSEESEDEWSHPLVRRQRLTLEQTLLLAILRQYYVAHEQEAGVGANGAVIDIDELKPQLHTYLGESGSEARDHRRVVNLLEKLASHGVVSEVDEKSQVTIRPIITHLANPETLSLLLQHLKQHHQASSDHHE